MKNTTKSFLLLVLFYWLPSTLFAEVTYYHTDAMGTPMAMTDSAGKVVWQGDFYPFGEEYQIKATPNKNKRRFTGKEKDEESGLHYFGARYMDEASGRFISPDPVTAVDPQTSKTNTALLGNPLRLNRYVYGLNNPHRYIDPDGREVQVHSRSVKGTMGAGAHTYVTVKNSDGIISTYGSYKVDGQNQVVINHEIDQGANSLPRTSSVTIPPVPGMSQNEWDRAVNQAGQGRNLTQRQDYDLWGGDGGDTSGNCHTTTRGIINDAGGSIPQSYDPPGLNPGLH